MVDPAIAVQIRPFDIQSFIGESIFPHVAMGINE